MSKLIEFSGFGHFPRGNANINLINDYLVVSDMKTSSDGVIINTSGAEGFDISLQPHELLPNEVLGATFNMKDGLGRIKTVSQWPIAYTKDNKYAYLMINSRLEGKIYK